MLKVVTAIFMLVVLVGSFPAFAEKHEIDQASVRAEGGFPYKITKSGSYKLTSNLVVPAGVDGIDIFAQDVTLDLNGFSIRGPVVCTGNNPATCPPATTGVGISVGNPLTETIGPTNVKVFNGAVRGMGLHGIFINGDGGLVEKVSAQSNAGAGIVVFGSVVESSAIGNGSTGILALIVRDSEAASNVGDGIIADGRGGVVIGVVSSNNGGRGIVAQNASVTGSTSTLNKGAGLQAICPSAILNNTIVANASSILTEEQGCVLENNGTRP
jgi:hypothetical protein